MIITVGGIKGGSGKSTVATNLVVLRSLEGRDVLLVDADTQTTSSDFSLQRNNKTDGNAGFTCIKLAGQAVRTETLRLADKYQDIIIDTGGRDTTSQRAALAVSDVLLVHLFSHHRLTCGRSNKRSCFTLRCSPQIPSSRAIRS